MKVRIDITKGPDQGRNFVLEANEKRVIGRGENVEVRMLDELVSREHCELEFDGKKLTVCDLGSTNKTFIQQPPNQPQPLTPHQRYAIGDRACFCVGPESWFNVVIEADTSEAVSPSPPPAAQTNSNFSASLVTPANRPGVMGSDSSIFNLTGPVSPSQGLEDFRPPPKPAPHKAPEKIDAPPTQAKPETSDAYVSGSIVPPSQQNIDQLVHRPQVLDEEFVDESHLKSTPSVFERTPDSEEEESPLSPINQSPSNTSPLGSLVPPPATQHPTTIKPEPVLRAKPDTTPEDAEIPARSGSQNPFESIAIPGQIYETVPPPSSSPLQESVIEPRKAAAVQLESTPLDSTNLSANVQPNGLYFHTGTNPAFLSRIISEIGGKLVPIFCVDPTRLGNEYPNETADKPLAVKPESDAGGVGRSDVSTSNFEIEINSDSPIDIPDERTGAETPQITGAPLFDFLPEELQHNGPMLMTNDQFCLPLEDSWQQDGLIVFFGNDTEKMVTHLRKLARTNIQTGKPSRAMFGFCWPTVLHSIFESQSKEAVGRIFGDCLTCILLEDPQERYLWNLVSQRDLNSEFGWLKEA